MVGGGGGGTIRPSTEDFEARETIFCVILQWWVHVTMRLSKPIKSETPRMNPDVISGLWVILMG